MDDEYLYKVVDALDAVAKETGKTVPQVALNWLLQRPTVATVIIGARNEEQLTREPRRRRLEPDAGAGGEARRGERDAAGRTRTGTSGASPSGTRPRCSDPAGPRRLEVVLWTFLSGRPQEFAMSPMSCVRTAVLPIVVLALAGCGGGYGPKVERGNLEVYYKDGATKEEAERLMAYIERISPPFPDRRTFQVRKTAAGYQVRMPVQKQYQDDEKALNAALGLDAARYSREVFNGAAVEMEACNELLVTLRTIPPRADVRLGHTDGKVEVLYAAEADKADVERLAKFLQPVAAESPAKIVTFKFARRDKVAEVSVVVDPKLIDDPGVKLSLEAIRQGIAESVFAGGPTELHLCDTFVQPVQVLK